MESADRARGHPDFYGFLDRMRRPAAADLVRAVKSFVVTFPSFAPDAEHASKSVQDFLTKMEKTIREHPLWANSSAEEIDDAIEALEKFVMTKLFNHTFASSTDDAKTDVEISDKVRLLQQFIKPDHLDVPKVLQNEGSFLVAAKELQKINFFKSPREKLMCIMNCCQVINNLLLNASMLSNRALAGADDFLPVLIYVTVKANPPQLHSNLNYIQHFRRETKLVSEMEYYLTNLISAKMFLLNVNASSLSMSDEEFEEHIAAAQEAVETSNGALSNASQTVEDNTHFADSSHDSDSRFPFMRSTAEQLTRHDVEKLLVVYKEVVTRYTLISDALRRLSVDEEKLLNSLQNTSGKEERKSKG